MVQEKKQLSSYKCGFLSFFNLFYIGNEKWWKKVCQPNLRLQKNKPRNGTLSRRLALVTGPPPPTVRRCSGSGTSCIAALAHLTLHRRLSGNTAHVGHRRCTRDLRSSGWRQREVRGRFIRGSLRDTHLSSVSGRMPGCLPKKKLDHQWPGSCFGSPADTWGHFQLSADRVIASDQLWASSFRSTDQVKNLSTQMFWRCLCLLVNLISWSFSSWRTSAFERNVSFLPGWCGMTSAVYSQLPQELLLEVEPMRPVSRRHQPLSDGEGRSRDPSPLTFLQSSCDGWDTYFGNSRWSPPETPLLESLPFCSCCWKTSGWKPAGTNTTISCFCFIF